MKLRGASLKAGSALAALLVAASAARGETTKSPNKDMLLQADTAEYNTNAHIVTAKGHVEIDYDELAAKLPANVIPAYDGMVLEF